MHSADVIYGIDARFGAGKLCLNLKEISMKRLFLTLVACLSLSVPALAMTEEECTTLWKQADANKDGLLTDGEEARYMAMMRLANKTLGADGAINEAIFVENCKEDVFATAVVDEGAPLEGASSFTETQAKDRAVAAGLSNVSSLIKDEKGIWRGTAEKDGKIVNVAVDFKGNVVTQ
jgi:hypothetical protein